MATPLQPTAYELVVDDPDDDTINERVTVDRDRDSPDDWLAAAASVGGARPGVIGAGDTPAEALKHLARTLRVIADRIDPLAPDIEIMMLGLVRAAEFKEQQEDGKLWDDECRRALEIARRLGWGKSKVGTLGVPTWMAAVS